MNCIFWIAIFQATNQPANTVLAQPWSGWLSLPTTPAGSPSAPSQHSRSSTACFPGWQRWF